MEYFTKEKSHCSGCRLKDLKQSGTIFPQARYQAPILIVVDYPTIEDDDKSLLFSGLNRRAIAVQKIIKQAGLSEKNFSFSSVCSCVIKSKSIISMSDYEYCSSYFLREAIKDIKPAGIISFGTAPGEILTGKPIMNVENVRGKILESIEGIPVLVTYQLGVITGSGCNSCNNQSSYSYFVRVDVEKMIEHLNSIGIKFVR